MAKKNITFGIQRLLGRWLAYPNIPKGKTYGFSLSRSVRSECTYGRHCVAYPPFYLKGVTLGDYTYISQNCHITNTQIGKFCSIGPDFRCGQGLHPTSGISTSPMFYSTARQNGTTLCTKDMYEESRQTHIGNDVFIGAGVIVLDGVSIGDGAVVGAGAVVVHDVPPYAVAVGVPAKVVKYRFDQETIAGLLATQWWNLPDAELHKVRDNFWNPKALVANLSQRAKEASE